MLSLSPLTVLPCSPLELIDAAEAAEFDAVGLRLVPVLPTDVDVMADAVLRRAIERRLSATTLRVLDIEVIRIGPDTDIAALVPLLQYAGELGARNLAVTSLAGAEYEPVDEPRMVRKLAELGEAAARRGIQPMIEFMVFRGIATLDDAIRVIARAGHQNLGICVDALHLQRSGGTPESISRIPPQLISCVQLCDAPASAPAPQDIPREARYDRLYPGEGALPLRELLAVVPPDIPLSVEVPCAAQSGLSVTERADKAARCTRELIASVHGRRPGSRQGM